MPHLVYKETDTINDVPTNTDICLIGFMGCGKSYIGEQLAHNLGYTFIDTDAQIESEQGKPIYEIFKTKGERYFRQCERTLLKDIVFGDKDKNRVIAMGGGIPIPASNRKLIKMLGSLNIYLNPPFETLYTRIKGTQRPLVFRRTRRSIFNLWSARYQIYEKIAHIVIADTNNADIFSTLNKRLKIWQEQHGKV